MDAHVELAPTFHFYRDGAKVKEYVGSSYPALEVRFPPSLSPSLYLEEGLVLTRDRDLQRTMGSVMNGQ